ncbi:Fcf2 pre-rRNA processing-domain-containing protein [Rhodotorula diobovata]|uniref:Fcf2 pre-rRNA processing-domain-containing protein n=1 Tax=Rhodotorula diobovata TaxID=5288 RepID=A0A5C5FXD7_9BASI|nr:Fcf2 pre-rRNA processing-domain-containing protein [Rhodotorula diobovata]
MPLTRSAVHRLHLEQSMSPSASPSHSLHPPPPDSVSSTLVSDQTKNAASVSSSSSSSSSSESSDSSDDDSDASDTERETDALDADPTAHLSALLARAKQAARERDAQAKAAKDKRGGEGDGLAGNEEVVLFGQDDDEEEDGDNESDDERDGDKDGSSTPRASTSRALPPSLARPLSHSHPLLASLPARRPTATAARTGGISLSQDVGGVLADAGATRVEGKAGEVDVKGKGKEVDRWGQAPLPQLSKKQLKAKQPHTAGAAWFDMPATPMTPQLKRELDALRLSAALDPKRFLRGGAKRDKVGEFFQVGHVIAPSTRATTLSSEKRVQKRSFVEDLVESEEAKAYARKKTKEVLAKTMSGRKRQRKGGKGAHAMGAGARK